MPWMRYLVVCPLVFLAGFVDAVAGGGGLISLPAYLMTGIPVHHAIGTNKLSSGLGTGLAAWRYFRSGYVPVKLAAPCVIFAWAGSASGARLALLVQDGLFSVLMLILLPATGIYVLKSKKLGGDREGYSYRKTLLFAVLVSAAVGLYDGFYGPGTGTFLILLLTGVARLGLQEANGVAKAVNLSTNVSALTVYLLSGNVLLALGLAAGCFSIAGNYVGTRFFSEKGVRIVRPVILLVLTIFFIRTLSSAMS